MKYRKIKDMKYQLMEDLAIQLPFSFETKAEHYFFRLDNHMLYVDRGYCWDGASGPTIDTRATFLASLAHDCLYQLIKVKKLDKRWRYKADLVLYKFMTNNGACKMRASVWKRAVNKFGSITILIGKEEEIIEI